MTTITTVLIILLPIIILTVWSYLIDRHITKLYKRRFEYPPSHLAHLQKIEDGLAKHTN